MPIYGYRCRSCGHELEVLQKISDPPLKTCPQCQGELQKLLYPAGVIFKGSGFYTTDYKSGAGSSGKAASNGSGNGASKSGESKAATEPKSESTTSKSDSTKEGS